MKNENYFLKLSNIRASRGSTAPGCSGSRQKSGVDPGIDKTGILSKIWFFVFGGKIEKREKRKIVSLFPLPSLSITLHHTIPKHNSFLSINFLEWQKTIENKIHNNIYNIGYLNIKTIETWSLNCINFIFPYIEGFRVPENITKQK